MKSSVGYVLLAGIVIFAAVLLGIRSAALFGSTAERVTPADLSNQSSLRVGDPIPPLPIVSIDGAPGALTDLTRDQAVVVAFVMPGCGPCGNLMADWSRPDFGKNAHWKPVIVAVGSREQAQSELPTTVRERYRIYTCDEKELVQAAGITVSPTLIGMGRDGKVSFVASGYSKQVDDVFLDNYVQGR